MQPPICAASFVDRENKATLVAYIKYQNDLTHYGRKQFHNDIDFIKSEQSLDLLSWEDTFLWIILAMKNTRLTLNLESIKAVSPA